MEHIGGDFSLSALFQNEARLSKMLKYTFRIILWSTWLPIAIMLLAWLRFSALGPGLGAERPELDIEALEILRLFAVTTPCAIPLTIALRQLFRRARNTAIAFGIVLIPLTTMGATVGGILGPLGIALYSLIPAIPAWLAVAIIVTWYQRRKARRQSAA